VTLFQIKILKPMTHLKVFLSLLNQKKTFRCGVHTCASL